MIASLGNIGKDLGKKIMTDLSISISLARDHLPRLVSNLSSNAISNVIDKAGRKINGKGAEKALRGFALFFSNENVNDIIRNIKSLDNLGALIDSVTETIKYEIKNQEDGFLAASFAHLAAPLVQPVNALVVQGIRGRGVRRSGRRYMDKTFSHAPSFNPYRNY